jgi:hypothetical protein
MSKRNQLGICVIRKWIKSWFYEIENEAEYRHSKSLLIQWLDDASGSILTPSTVSSVKAWIVSALERCEDMWLNYKRLHVCTMNLRVTSIAESMHSSMKSGFDGVRSAMATDVSALTMMDKAGRSARERHRHNADQVVRRQKWAKTGTANFLTNYCQAAIDNQWELAGTYTVVRASANEWWVYRPDNNNTGRAFPPRYYRLRIVRLINNRFCWCSCGLPSRVKYPCRHILAVTGEVTEQMFGLRWHAKFQYHYGRHGSEEWTRHFNIMLNDEFARCHRQGECILVSGMKFLTDSMKWKTLEMSDDTAVTIAVKLHSLLWLQKRTIVRGFQLPAIQTTAPCEVTLHEITCHMSNQIAKLQSDQSSASRGMVEDQESFEAESIGELRRCLDLAGNSRKNRDIVRQSLAELARKLTASISDSAHSAGVGQVSFPPSGKSSKLREKRRKTTGL